MSFSRSQYLKAVSIILLILIAVLLVTAISGSLALSNPEKYGMIATLLLGYFLYPVISKIGDWLDESWLGPIIDRHAEQTRRARRGFQGEDIVYAWLVDIVSDESILKNVELSYGSGKKFDIDFVVVDEKGITIVEVKNFSSPVRFEDDQYFQEKDGRKIPLPPNDDPRHEVRNHAYALNTYLGSVGIENLKLNNVLVFSNGLVSFSGEPGVFIAKDKESLRKFIDSTRTGVNYSPEEVENIKELLRNAK